MQHLLTLSFVRSALSVSVSMSLYGAVLTRTSSTDKPRATRSTWERNISASNRRQNNSALTFPDSAFNAGDVRCCKNPQTIRNPNQSGCRRCGSWRVSWWAELINRHLHLQILLILKPTKGCDWWRGLAVRQWGGVCVCVTEAVNRRVTGQDKVITGHDGVDEPAPKCIRQKVTEVVFRPIGTHAALTLNEIH